MVGTYGPRFPQPGVTPYEQVYEHANEIQRSVKRLVEDLPLSTPAYSPNPGRQFLSRSAGLKTS